MKSSMLNDLVAGNRLEAPWLRARSRDGRRVAAPVNATITRGQAFVDGAR